MLLAFVRRRPHCTCTSPGIWCRAENQLQQLLKVYSTSLCVSSELHAGSLALLGCRASYQGVGRWRGDDAKGGGELQLELMVEYRFVSAIAVVSGPS
jgi:hypothetical protein